MWLHRTFWRITDDFEDNWNTWNWTFWNVDDLDGLRKNWCIGHRPEICELLTAHTIWTEKQFDYDSAVKGTRWLLDDWHVEKSWLLPSASTDYLEKSRLECSCHWNSQKIKIQMRSLVFVVSKFLKASKECGALFDVCW